MTSPTGLPTGLPTALPTGLLPAQGRVAVVLRRGARPADLRALRAWGRDHSVHRAGEDLEDLHEDLCAADAGGRAAAVVDLVGGGAIEARLPLLLAHLDPGARLIVAVPRRPRLRERLEQTVAELVALRGSPGLSPPTRGRDQRTIAERDRHALAAGLDDLRIEGDWLVATQGVPTWIVVAESRTDRLLAAAPAWGRVLTHRLAATVTPSASFVGTEADEVALAAWSAPPLSLREHDDAVVASRMVARRGDLVLPGAFRDTTLGRPRTPVLTDWSRWAVRVPPELETGPASQGPAHLPGAWLYADNVLRGHFGHAVTEQLSQLWAWPEVLARHPDAGVLVGRNVAGEPLASWELELFEAAGVPRERVRLVADPVRVERLLTATPGYVVGRHVHPALRDLHDLVGSRLAAAAEPGARPRRVFLTRRGAKRSCRDAAEVEAVAVDHGFTVVAPEDHPLPDQVAMVRDAEAVAGYGGSAMFHLLLTDRPRPVVVVSSASYHVWNEKAISGYRGHPLTVVRGTPDVVSREFTSQSFHSDYRVDLTGPAGRVLRRALAELDE